MKAKPLFVALTALLAAGGLWLAQSAYRTHASQKSSVGFGSKMPGDRPKPGQMLTSPARLAPPDPTRKFRELTPEQRVKLARQGPIGG
jgi:hypothetical protein